jgi:CubicO group peptidase (beta-lactamase class C family)
MSGLREWRLIAVLSGAPENVTVLDDRDILRFASCQRALNFDPGTAWSYSNAGFNMFPILIERALGNGKTFQEFTREEISDRCR